MFPGIAHTSLPWFIAWSAVINDPLLAPASTTITASEIPLIILFLLGKFVFSGFVPTIYSDIISPSFFKIS